MTYKTDAILKESGKYFNVYIMNAPVYFASVQKPKKKYQSEDTEYALTAFVDSETREKLEEYQLNKDLYAVGKDKNKKKQVKFKLSSQLKDDEKNHYDEVKGLHGVSLTCPTTTKNGDPRTITVIDSEGNPFKEDVGNLSVCNIKMFAYKNQDDMLVVSIDTVQVIDHVPYEGGSGSGPVVDDVLGTTYNRNSAPTGTTTPTKAENVSEGDTGSTVDDSDDPFADFDDAIPPF